MTAAAGGDSLYVHSGLLQPGQIGIDKAEWNEYLGVPDRLPAAREYWLVTRYDNTNIAGSPVVPAPAAAAVVVEQFTREAAEAAARNLGIAGLQLDVDSPTGKLSDYAALLREVRKALPSQYRLSITALLDWFRDGTAMGEVAATVDEFVPQFYDAGERSEGAVAAPLDASRWSRRFSRFGKPFRIGISTFGRARRERDVYVYGDLTPLHIAPLPGIRAAFDRTRAGEVVARYEATEPVRFGWSELKTGQAIEFVLPFTDSIAAAVAEARKMGDLCGGVLFFRWPAFNESLAVYPDTALRAAGVLKDAPKEESMLSVSDGQCAAVHCRDLYLLRTAPLNAQPLRYRFESSTPLEYFVAADDVPARMTGARAVDLTLPPYTGRPRLYVGRAVSVERAEYRMEVIP